MAYPWEKEDAGPLWRACKRLPLDYYPYGEHDRDPPGGPFGADCSAGCKHYVELYDEETGDWDFDWGVCLNPKSHRCGLLTFEHQGCRQFEAGPHEEE